MRAVEPGVEREFSVEEVRDLRSRASPGWYDVYSVNVIICVIHGQYSAVFYGLQVCAPCRQQSRGGVEPLLAMKQCPPVRIVGS